MKTRTICIVIPTCILVTLVSPSVRITLFRFSSATILISESNYQILLLLQEDIDHLAIYQSTALHFSTQKSLFYVGWIVCQSSTTSGPRIRNYVPHWV